MDFEILRMLVTGDTHGEKARYDYYFSRLKPGDLLFVCGDWGYLFFNDFREKKLLDEMEKCNFVMAFVDGNHENFPAIYEYPVVEWCGGKVHQIRKNIVHLIRGEVYRLPNEKTIFAFGGAYSIDRAMRTAGYSWWSEEMPSEEEYENARRNLEKCDYKVDYILTHTAPEETMSIFHPYHMEEMLLNGFLEWVREKCDYKHWYFGHLHRDEDLWRHQTALFFEMKDMLTNESIMDV